MNIPTLGRGNAEIKKKNVGVFLYTLLSFHRVLVSAVKKDHINLKLQYFNNCFGDEYCKRKNTMKISMYRVQILKFKSICINIHRACLEGGKVHHCSSGHVWRVWWLCWWRRASQQPQWEWTNKDLQPLPQHWTEASHFTGGVCRLWEVSEKGSRQRGCFLWSSCMARCGTQCEGQDNKLYVTSHLRCKLQGRYES